ncbi:MAG: AsmA family protein, partial [Gammaproteobacteria bacterium]|nr:AsmA family protein [Gammaproteobacteria bacterium]
MSFIIRSLIKVLILFAVIAAMLEFMDLSITLDGARHTLSKKLTSYTGREIHIDGDIQLSLSYSPQLLVKRIHIKNSGDFGDEDFITISEVHIEIQLLPLLHGQIQLNDISADQAKIHLHQKADGSNNWSLTKTAETHEITETPSPDSDDESFNIERISLSKIELTNVDVLYRDDSRQQILNNSFDQLLIDISDDTKPLAEINGSIEGHPYAITFEAKSLEPHAAGEPWILQGTGHIADRQTNIHADIQYKEKEFILDLDFDVKNVDLGMLLDELEIITGQRASTSNISIKAKLHGKDLAELYEQAEISLQLGEGYWDLQQAGVDKNKKLIFSQASSFTSWNKPVEFSMDGKIEDIPVTINLKSNRLKEYFDDVDKMDLDLASSIAGTEITLKGTLDLPIKSRMFKLDITIQGKDLERLNPIIDTEFPPLNDFSLTGKLIANNKGYILKSSNASIG